MRETEDRIQTLKADSASLRTKLADALQEEGIVEREAASDVLVDRRAASSK